MTSTLTISFCESLRSCVIALKDLSGPRRTLRSRLTPVSGCRTQGRRLPEVSLHAKSHDSRATLYEAIRAAKHCGPPLASGAVPERNGAVVFRNISMPMRICARRSMALASKTSVRDTPMRFASQADWAEWLATHCAASSGFWLRLAKRGADQRSVSCREALEVALCYGWVDGQKKGESEHHWLQRFTPRSARASGLRSTGRKR
jgi:hypothetical protein